MGTLYRLTPSSTLCLKFVGLYLLALAIGRLLFAAATYSCFGLLLFFCFYSQDPGRFAVHPFWQVLKPLRSALQAVARPQPTNTLA
jgi:hypothetical protein